jgi:hypothetical protein
MEDIWWLWWVMAFALNGLTAWVPAFPIQSVMAIVRLEHNIF